MHQGAKKSACRYTPPVRCATLKTSDNASIPRTPQYLDAYQDPGVLVMLPGVAAIEAPHATGLWMTPAISCCGRRPMNAIGKILETNRYARCVETSKRVRWDIDKDVIQGRRFDPSQKFLPDGLSLADRFTTLSPDEKRFVSQIQGRTYANIFGLVERFINAKVLELSRDHALGDQEAVEALVRFSDEELKHQALFRRVEAMVGEVLPDGYRFDIDPDAVARVVLGKCTWAVLVLTLDIELFTQAHYRQSIDPDAELSELYKDVFLYHWKEECQHAILDELELARQDATLDG